jgi:hypothetical protein
MLLVLRRLCQLQSNTPGKAGGLPILIKNETHSIDQRIDGYIKLMDFISEIRKRLTSKFEF